MKTAKTILTYTLPILMGVGLVFAVLWGKTKEVQAEEYRGLSDEYVGRCVASCARCSEELCGIVKGMSLSLDKLRVTGSDAGRVLALEDIVRASAEAEKVLTRLPQSQVESMGLAAFLTRTGDYARSLSRKLLSGDAPGKADEEQLETLIEALQRTSKRLNEMLENGEFPVGTEEFDYYDTTNEGGTGLEFPSLEYDGPFSEAVENAEPKGLTGEEGSLEDARRLAERIAGVPLEYAGMTEGSIPTYDFTGDGADVSITVRGLMLRSFIGTSAGNAEGVPGDEEYGRLAEAGRAFLDAAGYPDMEPTIAEYRGGTALIAFVREQDGVLIYNDLVKVVIDRGTGRVTGADAKGIIMYGGERKLEAPALTEDEAGALLSEKLTVKSVRLALTALTPLSETLCYEFRASFKENEYFVYINAMNGREELIVKIVSDEYGERTE